MAIFQLFRKRGILPSYCASFMGALPDGWTHSRASNAWRFNASGLLEQVSSNVARINYDPNTLACLGYLHEDQRTQRLLYSRDYSQANWTKTNCTASANAVGLDGISNSAYTITANAANATILQTQTLTSAQRSGSVYIKRGSGSGGIDITLDGGTTWTAITGLSSSAWTRAMVVQTVTNPNFGIRVQTNGDSVILDHAQVEDAPFASSPIVSTSAANVVRAIDVLTASTGNWFNHTEGTLFADGVAPPGVNAAAAGYVVWQIDDGTANNRHCIARNQARAPRGLTVTAASTAGDCPVSATWGDSSIGKMAYGYKASDFVGVFSGAAAFPDVTGSVPASGITTMRIGPVAGGSYFNGHVRRLAYYNRRLSNSELQGLV